MLAILLATWKISLGNVGTNRARTISSVSFVSLRSATTEFCKTGSTFFAAGLAANFCSNFLRHKPLTFICAGQKLANSLQGAHKGSSFDGGISSTSDKEADHLRRWYNSLGEAVPALSTLGEQILLLANSHQNLCTSLEACVCSPLEKFRAGPLR
jgi:hypothetical protein